MNSVYYGEIPPRKDLDVLPLSPEEQAKFDKLFTPDEDGYYNTGYKEDHPLMGKDSNYFNKYIGAIYYEVEQDILNEQVSEIRIVPFYQNYINLDSSMGRVTIYLTEDNIIEKTYFETIYVKWKIDYGHVICSLNSE